MMLIGTIDTESHLDLEVSKDLQSGHYRIGEYELTREQLHEIHRLIGLALNLSIRKKVRHEPSIHASQEPEAG
jgi:hypothetical protein